MKETPMLMSTPMVKATQEDRKTCTRRIILPQPKPCRHKEVFGVSDPNHNKPPDWQGQILDWVGYKYSNREHFFCFVCGNGLKHIDTWSSHGIICPYGQVGDLLYIKETHYKYGRWLVNVDSLGKAGKHRWVFSPLNNEVRYYDNPPENVITDRNMEGWVKRPSIFMFKKDARIWREITGVRAERLQDITEEGARAEGVEAQGSYQTTTWIKPFIKLWDSLNAERGYGWDTNPWVWPIDYKRVVK